MMGSVKDLVTPENAYKFTELLTPEQLKSAVGGYKAPGLTSTGWGAWHTSGRFSVGDLKDKIGPQEIAHKGPVLATMVGLYEEEGAPQQHPSTYLGMLDPKDGEVVSARYLLDKGRMSSVVVMELVNTPKGKTQADLDAYHDAITSGEMTVYLADAESITRRGVPLGSSWFKKVANATGFKSEYETVATYDDTVALLDEIRAKVADVGVEECGRLQSLLDSVGLDEIPNPGYQFDAKIDFTTKFGLLGDVEISEDEAVARMAMTPEMYGIWQGMVYDDSERQNQFAIEHDTINIDGKVECAIVNGVVKFADFRYSPDENRLLVSHVALAPFPGTGPITYMIPTNKEVQRAVFRHHGIYEAIDKAKDAHGKEWLSHIFEFVDEKVVEEATAESIKLMDRAIVTIANRTFGPGVVDGEGIESMIDQFIPYASRVQPGQEKILRGSQ